MSQKAGISGINKNGLALADKLARLNASMIAKTVTETTLEAHEILTEIITREIEPHSGKYRRIPRDTVTDLVDTGFYRASWRTSFPSPTTGVVATSCEYAAVLEYGTDDGTQQAFFPARKTAKKTRKLFIKNAQRAIQEALR